MGVSLDRGQIELYFQGDKKGSAFLKAIPKGYLAVLVGEGEEQQRFVIPVMYVNHPLFMKLLKEAEEEYGFDQKGPIVIPCHVQQFLTVQCMIHKEQPDHSHPHLPIWCFRD